jgi:hypothetical protein
MSIEFSPEYARFKKGSGTIKPPKRRRRARGELLRLDFHGLGGAEARPAPHPRWRVDPKAAHSALRDSYEKRNVRVRGCV